jgi:hypothetical protein
MIQQVIKLQNAGYSILEIGHTKTKLKEDVLTKVQFEQLTCNLDNKYYNALKDKVNLVAMCYWENLVENIEEKKNAFTKKMDKVGELADRKRVMVFADDDNAIDTKTHFEYITHKIDLSAEGFIKAVEEAIAMKLGTTEDKPKKTTKKKAPKVEETVEEEFEEEISEDIHAGDEMYGIDEEITTEEIVSDVFADEEVDLEELCTEIRTVFKSADPEIKTAIKNILKENGMTKLDVALGEEKLKGIADMLGI